MSIWDGRGGFYRATLAEQPLTIEGEAREIVAAKPDIRDLARSFLGKPDEDWTFVDPEDVKRLARAVLESGR